MKRTAINFPLRILLGGLIGFVLSFALSMLGGVLLVRGAIPPHLGKVLSCASVALAAAAAALVGSAKEYRLPGALASAALLAIVLGLTHGIAFEETPWRAAIPAAILASASLGIGLIRIKQPQRRRKYR